MSKPFHTVLLAILPVLQILSVNRRTVSISEGAHSFVIALVFGLAIWAIVSLILKSLVAGAIPTSIFLLFFYVYTPLQLGLLDNAWVTLSRNSVLVPLIALIFLGAVWVAVKGGKQNRLKNITQKLNIFSIIVCALPMLAFFSNGGESGGISKTNPLYTSSRALDEKPNIYWIVLDAYGRDDVLKNSYGFDNAAFISELRQRGFLVDTLAKSNYSQTSLSLASMLNGDYLANLSAEIRPGSTDRRLLTKLIRRNNFAKVLRTEGYKTATFSTGYALTEDPNSDKYYGSRHFLGRNPITGSLINRTPLRLLSERYFLPLNGYEWHRDRVLDNFSKLATMPGLETPYFAFAHIASPHKPYIFSKTGRFSSPDSPFSFTENPVYSANEDSLYIEQLRFVNSKVLETIDAIFQREAIKPILVIQSDHGPNTGDASERMKILQARFFQGERIEERFSSINTSRAILNQLFEAELPFLDDEYYWSSYEKPFEFYIK